MNLTMMVTLPTRTFPTRTRATTSNKKTSRYVLRARVSMQATCFFALTTALAFGAEQDLDGNASGNIFEGAGMEAEVLRAELQDLRFALANARKTADQCRRQNEKTALISEKQTEEIKQLRKQILEMKATEAAYSNALAIAGGTISAPSDKAGGNRSSVRLSVNLSKDRNKAKPKKKKKPERLAQELELLERCIYTALPPATRRTAYSVGSGVELSSNGAAAGGASGSGPSASLLPSSPTSATFNQPRQRSSASFALSPDSTRAAKRATMAGFGSLGAEGVGGDAMLSLQGGVGGYAYDNPVENGRIIFRSLLAWGSLAPFAGSQLPALILQAIDSAQLVRLLSSTRVQQAVCPRALTDAILPLHWQHSQHNIVLSSFWLSTVCSLLRELQKEPNLHTNGNIERDGVRKFDLNQMIPLDPGMTETPGTYLTRSLALWFAACSHPVTRTRPHSMVREWPRATRPQHPVLYHLVKGRELATNSRTLARVADAARHALGPAVVRDAFLPSFLLACLRLCSLTLPMPLHFTQGRHDAAL